MASMYSVYKASIQRIFIFLLLSGQAPAGVKLTPAAAGAFNRYTELTEARMRRQLNANNFLWIDGKPEEKAKVRKGAKLVSARVTQDDGKDIDTPDSVIQDWLGDIFLPGATIAQVRGVMQDYASYQRMFAPEVTASKLLSRDGDRFQVFLRLMKRQIVTVVLNTDYDIRYGQLDPARIYIDSRSTRIAEAKDSHRPEVEYPVGDDSGFLWRLNSYWRFEEADGGVYAECEAISLSRDIPVVGWMLRGFIEKFPKDSMENTLRGVRKAVTGK